LEIFVMNKPNQPANWTHENARQKNRKSWICSRI